MTKPFFVDPFKGILCLFMLEMGLLAAQRLAEVRRVGFFLVAFAVCMPVLYGLFGVLAGGAVGLSIAGATLLGVLAARPILQLRRRCASLSPKRIPPYISPLR